MLLACFLDSEWLSLLQHLLSVLSNSNACPARNLSSSVTRHSECSLKFLTRFVEHCGCCRMYKILETYADATTFDLSRVSVYGLENRLLAIARVISCEALISLESTSNIATGILKLSPVWQGCTLGFCRRISISRRWQLDYGALPCRRRREPRMFMDVEARFD